MTLLQDEYASLATEDSGSPSRLALLCRYMATGRHLRPKQAFYWVFRRGLGRRYRVPQQPAIRLRANFAMADVAATTNSGLAGNSFNFINQPWHFPGGIDWHLTSHPLLWRYNLHYFDYALDPSRDTAWVVATMKDWIAKVPSGPNDGWQPYPVSLRVVNWIKFWLLHPGDFELTWHTSLYQQVSWLERNLEYEIQANHLLKNAKALVFGGAFFAGRVADRWLRTGLQLLLTECRDQFLADGGHFERSAMYHAIALEDLLDVINLARATPGLLPAAVLAELIDTAAAAAAYLAKTTPPSGGLPMFNDSVDGIAKDAATLAHYAETLGVASRVAHQDSTYLIDKPQTGYFGYRHQDEWLLIDAGPIGPAHQPGHGHCDLLSFELVIDGRQIVVDSGVFDYENTGFRRSLRRTAAHNTLRIDRTEQSDVWGGFRVGRRARPGEVMLQEDLPASFRFTGTHDGFAHLSGRPVHHRTIECRIGQSWQVTDHVRGTGQHLLESFVHFHPDLRLRREDGHWLLVDAADTQLLRVSVNGGNSEMRQTAYCPAFGIRRHKETLRISITTSLPHTFGYLIEAL